MESISTRQFEREDSPTTWLFLYFFCIQHPNLCSAFRWFRLTCIFSDRSDEGEMDILYAGAIAALWLMTAAFVRGCEKLGRRQ
jgi:hypothetical protein